MSNYYLFLPVVNKSKNIKKIMVGLGLFALVILPLGNFGWQINYSQLNASASTLNINDQCQQAGFDFGVVKWEWENDHYVPEGAAQGTAVTGDERVADWTAQPAVAGVISKAGTDSTVFSGGTSGTIMADKYDISHLTFCGNKQVAKKCELTLTKQLLTSEPIQPGDEIEYYLTLENTGTANCTGGGVRLKDYWGSDFNYVTYRLGGSYPSNQAFQQSTEYGQWNFATLNPGDFREVWLDLQVKESLACDSTVVNKAKYYANETGWSDYRQVATQIVCEPEPYCGDGIVNQPSEQCDGEDGLIEGFYCTSKCQLNALDPVCPLNAQAYDNIINVSKRLVSHLTLAEAQSEIIPVSISSGIYDVTLVAHDAYLERIGVFQPNEQYYVSFIKNGVEVAKSNAHDDLADYVKYTELTQLVNEDLFIPEADSIQAIHLISPSPANNPNSLNTVCIGLNKKSVEPEPYCGDGIVNQPSEECDDQDGVGEYQTCSATCELIDLTYCGDGIKQTPNDFGYHEECDGQDGVGFQQSCSNDCQLIDLDYCGDGKLDVGEECDDGNNLDNDGCSAQCLLEYGAITGCKYNDQNNNGLIDPDEETLSGWTIVLTKPDQSQLTTVTNEMGCYAFENLLLGTYMVSEQLLEGWSQTYPSAPAEHTVVLTAPQTIGFIDFANYQTPGVYCGDGEVNQPTEECDWGEANGNVCTPVYNDSCQYCSLACTLIDLVGPYCGDGVVNGTEECDWADPVSGEHCSSECTLIELLIDLELTKQVNPSSVEVGQSTVFTLELRNNGNQPATSVSVAERLPAGLTYQSHSASAGFYYPDIQTWSIPELGVGALATLTLTVQANQIGVFDNVAEVVNHNETDVDSTPNNNDPSEDDQDNASLTVVAVPVCTENCGGGSGGPVTPQIILTKSAAVAFTNPDTIVDYTLSVTNIGSGLGQNLVITDELPMDLEYVDVGLSGVWNLGNIAANQTQTINYQVSFPSNLNIGFYTNTAVAEISNGNSSTDDATVEVRIPTVYSERYEPLLAIDKIVDRTFTNPGGEAVYTVTITNTNTGNLTAVNVVLVDRLPEVFTFADDGTQVKGWPLGDIAPGETKTISFTVNVKSTAANGVYDNIATVYADNAPEVSDIEPLEVRQVIIKGFVLPDTNGSAQFFLSFLAGALLIVLGLLIKKYRQLADIKI